MKGKKIFAMTAALMLFGLCTAGLLFAVPGVKSVSDSFEDKDMVNNQTVDRAPNDDNETPKKTAKFWWGGFSAGDGNPGGGHESIWLRETWPLPGVATLGFNLDASAPGSRIYTRFDSDSEDSADKKNNSSIVVDVSSLGSTFEAYIPLTSDQKYVILIRDDERWYKSEELLVETAARWEDKPPQELSIKIHELDWFPVVWDEASRDMDEVDKGGETGPLTAETNPGTPNFSSIMGLGLELTAEPNKEGIQFLVGTIGLESR
jgi:hypothetical protein